MSTIPISFCFNGYENNPIVQYCIERTPRTILTEKDLLPIINKLRHSKWSYDNRYWSFVGDQLRLYLALQSNDFLYLDADVFIDGDPNDIKMHHCAPRLNNGTFFRANKNTEWVKDAFEFYQNNDIGKVVNYILLEKFRDKIPMQNDVKYVHYFTSYIERFDKRDISKVNKIYFDAEDEMQVRTNIYKDRLEWHYYNNVPKAKEFLLRDNKDNFEIIQDIE